MFCSRCSKPTNQTIKFDVMNQIQNQSRFQISEVQELEKRFKRMSSGMSTLTKQQFRDNLGLLGLETVYFLSDSLFSIIDQDKDGVIQFYEFVQYFDKITNGDQNEKAEISFRLIDQDRKNYFTINDFKVSMNGLIQSWIIMTGQQLTEEVREHFELRIQYIFNLMDTNNDEKVSLEEYQHAILKDPTLLNIFEFLKKGVTETIRESELNKYQLIIDELTILKNQNEQIFNHMLEANQDMKQSHSIQRAGVYSSMILHLTKMKQQSSSIGIKYLMGEDIDAISIKMPSVYQPDQKSDMLYSNKIKGDTDPLDKRFSLPQSQMAQNYQLEEALEKIKHLNEYQLRDNYRETLIRVHEFQSQINKSMNKIDELYQEKLKEFNSKYNKEQECVKKKQLTIQNIHKSLSTRRSNNKNSQVQFGHQNWNQVINMMIGIQMAVKSVNAIQEYNISEKDFKLKCYFELMPKRIGNQQNKICKFYDYSPQIFNSLRKIHNIDSEDYLSSIGPETLLSSLLKGNLNTLSELTSSGKSGSFFYYSQDGTYTLKTISKTEFTFLQEILQKYYYYLRENPNSLIIRIYGMHKMILDDKKQYIIIMSNVFKNALEIHQRYDIKGSLYQRTTPHTEDHTVARKDQDFLNSKELIQINPEKQKQLLTQIYRDSEFFSQNNIIDYSLLLGIHTKIMQSPQIIESSQQVQQQVQQQQIHDFENFNTISSENHDKIYFFGIIDILTQFNTSKHLEYYCKRAVQGPTISAIPPQDYAERFRNFVSKMFSHQS